MIVLSKVWHDLWSHKSRTIQVVLVIALGAIGIGLVIGGRNLIAGTIADQWRQAEPPNIRLAVTPALTADQLRGLERIDGVYQVEGLQNTSIEWRLLGQSEWQTARLEARQDFQEQKMELVKLVSGRWPDRSALGVIKTADMLYGVGEGDTIEVRTGDQVRRFRLDGTLKPVGPFPVVFLGSPVFYADAATFSRLTGRDTFDTVLTRDQVFDPQRAEATDLAIQAYFEDNNIDSVGTLFPNQNRIISPDIPPAAELLNAIFLILGLIGVIIIVLGIFLVYNSISAIVTQQVNQIGVMKAIGARPWQVLSGYALLVLVYGGLASLLAVPVGGLGARGLQDLFINLLNLEDPGFTFDPTAVAFQVAVCLGVTVLAAAFPLRTAVRITIREAINTYGLTGSANLVDRLAARLRQAPYTLLLMVGNAFRNRRRVFFIELTLVLAGVIFMMVSGVNDATRYTFGDKLQSIHNYQVTLQFEEPLRTQRVEGLAASLPEIKAVETWLVTAGKGRPVEQTEDAVTDPRLDIFGLPGGTGMYRPDLVAGRWLDTHNGRQAVITQRLAASAGWRIGDLVTLSGLNGQESDWQIIGITYDPLARSAAFVPLEQLQREWGQMGLANTLWIQTAPKDAASLTAIAARLTELYEVRGLDVAPGSAFRYTTITEIVEETTGGYSLIITLLAIMAVIIAVVGGVGLSGVLSLSVLERRREVGVMRSIGASDRRVISLFVGEGILLGWLSWLIALPLSIPAAYLLTTQGLSLALNQQLAYRFSPEGPLAWLAIITLLSVLASALPARSAARVSVRESLAYP
jgi:putative ABC transport system permease protein